MAIESAYSSAVNLRLNAGIRPGGGTMLTKTTSLGRVMYGADKDAIWAVVTALVPCLAHPLYRCQRVETTVIES
jgi:hypothetical protein